MNVPHKSESEQSRLWNGPSGHAWVETQDVLDQMYKPIEDLLVEVVSDSSRHRVLDVGCGTGSTTLAVARRLGKGGRSIGIDISQPMIAVARRRAEREHLGARFICADAQGYPFEPESVDAIMSRFGVMFFDEPVTAFANLRRAATENGELRAIVWRSAAETPFMTTAERAAAPLLSNLPPRRPNVPGQFALADDRRVHAILEESGWAGIDIRPIDVDCSFAERDLVRYVTRLGPVGLALRDVDEATRARVVPTVRAAFDPFVHGAEVRFTAACWMVRARAQSS
jgi:SAM-dependent methyltransferase